MRKAGACRGLSDGVGGLARTGGGRGIPLKAFEAWTHCSITSKQFVVGGTA